jgi:hypothetical protein
VTAVTPSQLPPHAVPSPLQAARAPWGLPVTGTQVPSLPARSHAAHCAAQSVLQQTPSVQLLLVHSFAEAHAPPLGFFTSQVPEDVQNALLAHSASAAQVVAHAAPEHPYGAQSMPVESAQTPRPLHSLPVTFALVQVVAPHETEGLANARQAPMPLQKPSARHELG